MIAQKKFREDFFFRINVIPIHIPPLRERMEDIPLLVNTFIHQLKHRTDKNITGLSPEAMDHFMTYHWPGNVRELKNALEYAFVIAEQGLIAPGHLPVRIKRRQGEKYSDPVRGGKDSKEKQALLEALRLSKGNKSQAARILGVNRVTVWNRMKKYDIKLEPDWERI